MAAADCVHFLVIGMYHIKSSHYTVCSRFLSLSIIKNRMNYADHFLEILTPPSFCEHFYSVNCGLFVKFLEILVNIICLKKYFCLHMARSLAVYIALYRILLSVMCWARYIEIWVWLKKNWTKRDIFNWYYNT